MTDRIEKDDLERIRAIAAAGNKIEAIKMYRQATGAGLAQAKAAVEGLMAGRPISTEPVGSVADDDVKQIEAAIFAGEKIQAIRIYRQSTGEGLKESKDFIEALEAELRRSEPAKFTAPAAKGCGVSVLAIVVCLALLAGILFRL